MGKSLANKYRPATFDDLTEQALIVDILTNMCSGELNNRNFLFIGPAGCGKTTSARIVGKMLNGGTDSSIEIDAASYGGVDAVREIVKQAQTFPINANYKIIIYDEAHLISPAGWGALLKVTEEQPARTVFIFCTTNPEKIPDTIISRVQTFQLSKISLSGIYNRLKYVVDAEIAEGQAIQYTNDSLMFIAKLAAGGMRAGLTLLDRVIAFDPNITSKSVVEALNLPSYDDYFTLLGAIAGKKNADIVTLVDKVYNSGTNFVTWFEQFHQFVISIVKYILLQDINSTIIPAYYEEKISKYTTNHLNLCLRLGTQLSKMVYEMKSSTYQQEIVVTYLCKPVKES